MGNERTVPKKIAETEHENTHAGELDHRGKIRVKSLYEIRKHGRKGKGAHSLSK